MAELFILEPVSLDEPDDRIPEDLPLAGPERTVLERALRKTGLAIVAVDAVVDSAPPVPDGRRLRASVAAVVNDASDTERDRLESAVTADSTDDLDESFWGAAPGPVAASQALFADLRDQFAQRRRLAAESISRDEAAELLGVSPQSITSKLGAGKLVGIKAGREWRLPAWQFSPDDPSGVLQDLDVLQQAFPGGVVSLSQWMQRQQPEFGGRTAVHEMLQRGSAPVIALAEALTAAAW